jgi:hypothetical protein
VIGPTDQDGGVLMVLMGILMEMLMMDERGREEKDTLHPRMSVRG